MSDSIIDLLEELIPEMSHCNAEFISEIINGRLEKKDAQIAELEQRIAAEVEGSRRYYDTVGKLIAEVTATNDHLKHRLATAETILKELAEHNSYWWQEAPEISDKIDKYLALYNLKINLRKI